MADSVSSTRRKKKDMSRRDVLTSAAPHPSAWAEIHDWQLSSRDAVSSLFRCMLSSYKTDSLTCSRLLSVCFQLNGTCHSAAEIHHAGQGAGLLQCKTLHSWSAAAFRDVYIYIDKIHTVLLTCTWLTGSRIMLIFHPVEEIRWECNCSPASKREKLQSLVHSLSSSYIWWRHCESCYNCTNICSCKTLIWIWQKWDWGEVERHRAVGVRVSLPGYGTSVVLLLSEQDDVKAFVFRAPFSLAPWLTHPFSSLGPVLPL